MIKTCLLLSGLARSVESSYQNIYENLIKPNDADVFIHCWLDIEKEPNLYNKILELYRPKKFIIEKQKVWNNSHIDMDRMMAYAKAYTRQYFVDALYSAWYSIQQANLLKEQYRLENDLVYDYSIRARFDMNYNKFVDCSQYKEEIIYVSNRWLPEGMTEDFFGFGPNHLMNIYCSAFNFIDNMHKIKDKTDGMFSGEILLYEIFKAFGIKSSKIQDLEAKRVND